MKRYSDEAIEINDLDSNCCSAACRHFYTKAFGFGEYTIDPSCGRLSLEPGCPDFEELVEDKNGFYKRTRSCKLLFTVTEITRGR